jgi:hypothetical protein
VGLQGLLVRQQTVERAVQPVIVDALFDLDYELLLYDVTSMPTAWGC